MGLKSPGSSGDATRRPRLRRVGAVDWNPRLCVVPSLRDAPPYPWLIPPAYGDSNSCPEKDVCKEQDKLTGVGNFEAIDFQHSVILSDGCDKMTQVNLW